MPAKPTRSTLDLFLLALIREGVNTLYDIREQAGVSVGAAQPALRRLSKQRLIKASADGSRGKQEHVLTPAGRKVLAGEWRRLMAYAPQKPFADTESLLRLIAMAGNRSGPAVMALLDRIIAERKRRGAVPPDSPGGSTAVAKRYRGLLHAFEKARLAAEAEQFARLKPAGAAVRRKPRV